MDLRIRIRTKMSTDPQQLNNEWVGVVCRCARCRSLAASARPPRYEPWGAETGAPPSSFNRRPRKTNSLGGLSTRSGSKWPKNHEIAWGKCVPVDMEKIIFRAKSFVPQLKSVNWEAIKEQNLQFRRCTQLFRVPTVCFVNARLGTLH